MYEIFHEVVKLIIRDEALTDTQKVKDIEEELRDVSNWKTKDNLIKQRGLKR